MITKFKLGDRVRLRDIRDFYWRSVPGKVIGIEHASDEHGDFTTLQVELYDRASGHVRTLFEPEIRWGLTHDVQVTEPYGDKI